MQEAQQRDLANSEGLAGKIKPVFLEFEIWGGFNIYL